MRMGRGDGSTDDAGGCGLRTVRHTRPEVESMCAQTWVWLRDRGMHIRTRIPKCRNLKEIPRPIHDTGRLNTRTIT
jgi:hypothetical protein